MRTIRSGLAVAGSELALTFHMLVAMMAVLLPIVGATVGLIQLSHARGTVQASACALIGVSQVLWLVFWARRVHRLAGNLAPHRLILLSEQFRAWQRDRVMPVIVLSYRAPHEGLPVIQRYAMARRLDAYLCETNHQQLWQRALRLLPQRFVLYVTVYAGMTKLFDIGRLRYVAKTHNTSVDAWLEHLAGRVNSIYA